MAGQVAVLGAAGFIGSRSVEYLESLDPGCVRAIARRTSSLAHFAAAGITTYVADGSDTAALTRAFSGCDAVIHAISGDSPTIRGVVEPVYRAAEKARVRRIVYLSTASVHGQAPDPGTTEETPLSDRQSIAYNNAKVQAEWRFAELRRAGSVEIVSLRPGIVYGPGSFWIKDWADDLLAGRAYFVGGVNGICNCIYVDNVAHAIRLALDCKSADGEAYLLNDAETVTWGEFYRPISELLGFDFTKIPVFAFSKRARAWPEFATDLRLGKFARAALSRGATMLRDRMGILGRKRDAANIAPIQPTEERALLYTCRWRFPYRKAETELGYKPVVSFEVGQRRSLSWLGTAGYPVRGG